MADIPAFDNLLVDAAGMVGGGPILAEELSSAMRGMDQLLVSLQNQGILLHKIDSTVVTCSTASVTIDNDFIDIDTVMVNTTAGAELVADRLGYRAWAQLPNKDQEGRPNQYWFNRQKDFGVINLWPTPDVEYTLTVWGQKMADDLTRAYSVIDLPKRFWPAVTFALAYWIGLRRPRVDLNRLALLKAEYAAHLKDAMREDRERGSYVLRLEAHR
jgi:hypothetical protein